MCYVFDKYTYTFMQTMQIIFPASYVIYKLWPVQYKYLEILAPRGATEYKQKNTWNKISMYVYIKPLETKKLEHFYSSIAKKNLQVTARPLLNTYATI